MKIWFIILHICSNLVFIPVSTGTKSVNNLSRNASHNRQQNCAVFMAHCVACAATCHWHVTFCVSLSLSHRIQVTKQSTVTLLASDGLCSSTIEDG